MPTRALLLALALLASACSSTPEPPPDPDPGAPRRLAAALTQTDDPEAATEAAVEALARVGVATFDDELNGPVQQIAGNASPLRLARFQVANLARSVHAGTPGARLDELAGGGPPGEAPPFAAILTGYVAAVDTFGAQLSRALMERQHLTDPASVVFPEIVLTLFVADVLPRAAASGDEGIEAGGIGAAVLGGGGGFCAELQGFLSKVTTSIQAAISSLSDIPFLGTIITYVGDVLSYPAQVLADLVNSVPFFQYLKTAVGLAGVLIMAASALRPWTLVLSAQPIAPHYQVEGQGEVAGEYRAEVITGQDPLEVVRPCAEIAGITLPEAEEAAGTPVTWTPVGDWSTHLIETSRDMTVSAGNTALLTWRTSVETLEAHEHGTEMAANPAVEVVVAQDFLDIAALAEQLFGSSLLLDVIQKILGPLVAQAEAALQTILGLSEPHGAIAVALDHHAAQAYEWVMTDDIKQRTWTWTGRSCNGLLGPWKVKLELVGHDVLAGTFASGKTTYEVPAGKESGHFEATVKGQVVVPSLTAGILFGYKVDATPSEDAETMVLDINESVKAGGPVGSFSGLEGVREAPMVPLEEC